MNVESMKGNQLEMLNILRGLAAKNSGGKKVFDIKELIPEPVKTPEEMDALSEKIKGEEVFREQLVTKFSVYFHKVI